jgi:hypothetical protein
MKGLAVGSMDGVILYLLDGEGRVDRYVVAGLSRLNGVVKD